MYIVDMLSICYFNYLIFITLTDPGGTVLTFTFDDRCFIYIFEDKLIFFYCVLSC